MLVPLQGILHIYIYIIIFIYLHHITPCHVLYTCTVRRQHSYIHGLRMTAYLAFLCQLAQSDMNSWASRTFCNVGKGTLNPLQLHRLWHLLDTDTFLHAKHFSGACLALHWGLMGFSRQSSLQQWISTSWGLPILVNCTKGLSLSKYLEH